MKNQQLILTKDAAEILNVSSTIIVRLANSGRLPCTRAGKRNIRLFQVRDIEHLAAERAAKKAAREKARMQKKGDNSA